MTRERGSMSIVSAGVMIVVAVLALGCADLAKVLAVASRAQTAADAAALAAAQALAVPEDGVAPEAAADEYAAKNGAELVSCECDAKDDDIVVEVRVAVGRLLLFGSDRTLTSAAHAVVERRDPEGDYAMRASRSARAWSLMQNRAAGTAFSRSTGIFRPHASHVP